MEAVTLIAHAGHTLTTIAYFVPVVVFLAWLIVTQVRERRSRRSGG
jgi:Flp pilus assembly protein TadB